MGKNKKQYNKRIPDRNKINLMDIHRRVVNTGMSYRAVKPSSWIRILYVFVAAFSFFAIGYLVASLTIPIWGKAILFGAMTIIGFILSCIITVALR